MPLWLVIVLALGGTALINCIITFGFNASVNGSKKKQAQKKAKQKEEDEKMITDVLSKQMGPLLVKVDNIEQLLTLDKEGTVTLLRDSMEDYLIRYQKQGFATDNDKARWLETYHIYDRLGGNHFKDWVDRWKVTLENLPKEDPSKGE